MKFLPLRRTLPWGVVFLILCASSVLAAERLTVVQLQKYHESYQIHSVTLVGQVRSMHALPPVQVNIKKCRLLYGIAQFELVDDTGTLQVETQGSCFAAAMKLPENGDVIELTAQIQVFSPDGRIERVIKAIAQDIVVVKPVSQDHQSP